MKEVFNLYLNSKQSLEDELAGEVLGEMKDIYIRQKTMEWENAFFPIAEEARKKRLTFI